jgi:hypothetical protein|tara:strand:+ start:1259 stop:1492 length:234 start_codon:yes stop_codon:yes gene_type:complete
MVEIEVGGIKAQIKEGVWTSQDAFLLNACEMYMVIHPWRPIPSVPDPDYDVAEFVVEKMAGKITKATQTESLPNMFF